MSFTPESLTFFAGQIERDGSIVIELPMNAERFVGAEGQLLDFCIVRCADDRLTIMIPEHVRPRTPVVAYVLSSSQTIQGWRPLALPQTLVAMEALRQVGVLHSGTENEVAHLVGIPVPAESRREGPLTEANENSTRDASPAVRVAANPQDAAFAVIPFTRNLTLAAQRGEIAPVQGRESETRQLITILCQAQRNSALLCGEPGVGKTAIVEKLAQISLQSHQLPAQLLGCTIYSLDAPALVAECGIKGAFEKNVAQLLEAVTMDRRAILFVDELHALTEARGDLAFTEMLKPPLARGLRMIGATTHAEFKGKIASDAALVRRFDIIHVNEPDIEETLAILQMRLPFLEEHHGVSVGQELLERIVALADEYFPHLRRPDKALMLLDRAMSAEAVNNSLGVER